MTDGWRCPGCGSCYAPYVHECYRCSTAVWPARCEHVTEPTTAGDRCVKCGAIVPRAPLPFTTSENEI